MFWCYKNSLTNHEWTKRSSFYVGPRSFAILCVIVGKINNMLLCVKFMLICACMMY